MQLVDLVKIYVNSTGTGVLTLGGPVPSYRGVEALQNGEVYGYSIQQGSNYEYGRGTFLQSSNQFVRSPIGSSVGGGPINLQPNAQIAFVALAEDYFVTITAPLYGNGAPAAGLGVFGNTYYDISDPSNPIFYGPKTPNGWGAPHSLIGPAGPAAATFLTLAAFKAASTANATQVLKAPGIAFGLFLWETAGAPYTADDINIIKADSTALSVGAWVRQRATSIQTTNGQSVQAALDAVDSSYTFAQLPTATFLANQKRVVTNGFSSLGVGGAVYINDPAVNGAYVTAHPGAAVLDAAGRGWRLDDGQALSPLMFGTAGGTGYLNAAAWGAFRGQPVPFLAKVATHLNTPVTYGPPAGWNDQLGNTQSVFDGLTWSFQSPRFDVLDFRTFATYTSYWVDYVGGLNANNGTTKALAWKTFDYAMTQIAALAAGSRVELNVVGDVGYLSGTNLNSAFADGKHVVIVGGRFLLMREDYTQAAQNWVTHGTPGAGQTQAWKATGSAIGPYVAAFFTKQRDKFGLPLPIVSTGQSAATVLANELVHFYDPSGTPTWYMHLPGGAKPDPFVNMVYSNNAGERQFTGDTGTLLLDGCEVFSGASGGSFSCLRIRANVAANAISAMRFGYRNCKFYGASANAVTTYDMRVVAREKNVGGYCYNDIFNDHSFNLTAAKGQATTVYAANNHGHAPGYAGFAWSLTPSGSDNAETEHDAMSAWIVGGTSSQVKDCAYCFVGGSDMILDGARGSINMSGGSSFYASSICYECNTGWGQIGKRRLLVRGCSSDYGTGTAAIQLSGNATDAVILVDRWYGDAAATLSVYDPNTGNPSGGTIRALSDNSVLFGPT